MTISISCYNIKKPRVVPRSVLDAKNARNWQLLFS